MVAIIHKTNSNDGKVLYLYSNVTEPFGLQLEGIDKKITLKCYKSLHGTLMAVGPT